MTPARFTTPPERGVTAEPGVYTFGFNEQARRMLNFSPGLFSYTKLYRFANPDKKISKFVAGVGNLVSDTLLFGPEVVAGRYYFHHENVKFNTREGKAWRDAWERDNPDQVLIRPKEREEAQRLIEIALANDEIKRMLNAPGYCEAGVVADLEGLRFRSWLDKLMPKAIVDLKTTRAKDEAEFLSGVLKYQYDVQAALYLDQCEALGLGQLRYFWCVISKVSNRAWMTELPPWGYWSGKRWLDTVLKSYHRETSLQQQLRDSLKENV